MEHPYIWYASYGSNICRERFLCYIEGGKPPGSSREERGCGDTSLPLEDEPVDISYPLYFAGSSRRWGGGVAFIGHKKTRVFKGTLGRKYLIKEEQFREVVAQENNRSPIPEEGIDYAKIEKKGIKQVFKSLYGSLVYLGRYQGCPIYTFTSGQDLISSSNPFYSSSSAVFSPPSESYLKTLMKGLGEAYYLSREELASYFQDRPGVQGYYSREELVRLADRT